MSATECVPCANGEHSDGGIESVCPCCGEVLVGARELLARDLCDTYYLTVDPDRPMIDAFSKITEKTREHWRAQAEMLIKKGWSQR